MKAKIDFAPAWAAGLVALALSSPSRAEPPPETAAPPSPPQEAEAASQPAEAQPAEAQPAAAAAKTATPSAEAEAEADRARAATSRALAEAETAKKKAEGAESHGKELAAGRYLKTEATWRQVARTLEKAARLELEAESIESETTDLEARSRRAAMLVEQTEARRARALARLQELGLTAPLAPPGGSEASSAKPQSGAQSGPSTPQPHSAPAAKETRKTAQ